MQGLEVSVVSAHDAKVPELIHALTAELADAGYTDEESFGYTAQQLERSGVHLVGAMLDGVLVGIGGIEIQADGCAELKRFYVAPDHRGRGVADQVMDELVQHARKYGVMRLRLETGDKQHAAMRFYARHHFAVVPRFEPYTQSATSVCMQRAI